MEIANEATPAASALVHQPSSPGAAPAVVAPEDKWQTYAAVPLNLMVTFPLKEITLSRLSSLKPGVVLHSTWAATQDVVISAEGVFLANVSFEPVGTRLGVRISNFTPRLDPIAKQSSSGTKTSSHDREDSASPLLKDLWLDLSVCVGSSQTTVSDTLQWNTGDIIALDRELDAPVGLLLRNRILGYGRLVLHGGCYAIQLSEIAPRAEGLPHCSA